MQFYKKPGTSWLLNPKWKTKKAPASSHPKKATNYLRTYDRNINSRWDEVVSRRARTVTSTNGEAQVLGSRNPKANDRREHC